MTNDKNVSNQEENTTLSLNGTYKDFEKLLTLYESGELEKQLGIYILNLEAISKYKPEDAVQKPIDLSQWLQNKFTEAEEALWLTVEEIFPRKSLAFREANVQRAKQIQLEDLKIVITLYLELTDDKEMRILLGLYPLENQTNLPKNLTVMVIDNNQENLVEVSTENYPDGLTQELFFDPEESFTVKINYSDFSYRENFIV